MVRLGSRAGGQGQRSLQYTMVLRLKLSKVKGDSIKVTGHFVTLDYCLEHAITDIDLKIQSMSLFFV